MKNQKKLKIIIACAIIVIIQIYAYANYFVCAENELENVNNVEESNQENNTEPRKYINIKEATISNIPNQTYTGQPIKPTLTIKYNGITLRQNIDYGVSYKNNQNVGTATITITGLNDYVGTITKNFSIKQKSIKELNCIVNTSYHTYTGAERNASVKIYNGNTKLKYNTDYTLLYKNNINTGKASVTIKGKGNYTGTITKSYYIVPRKSKIISVTMNSKATQATIKWKKDPQASGYAIYMSTSKDGKYQKIKQITSTKTTTYVKKGLNPNKVYYFKISSYKIIGNKKRYSKKYSEPKTNVALIAKVTLNSPKSGASRNYNLKKASSKVNGTILKPGETFNWFNIVGAANKANGYKKATVFLNGKSVPGYGGGVCQVSTTIYQASLKCGLKIVERHTHSLPVSYTTKGKDATVSYGSKNLKIKNNKNYSIKLVTYSNGGETTCEIYRTN